MKTDQHRRRMHLLQMLFALLGSILHLVGYSAEVVAIVPGTATPLYRLGKSFSLLGEKNRRTGIAREETQGGASCFVHDGAKKQVVAGTGLRAEIIADLGEPTTLFEILSLAPPERWGPLPEAKIGRFAFEDWLSKGSLVLIFLLARDDGIFEVAGLRPAEGVDTTVSKEGAPTCGPFIVDQWREQAYTAWILRPTLLLAAQALEAKRILKEIPRDIVRPASLARAEQFLIAGREQIYSFQKSVINARWPPRRFWELLLTYGPIDVERISTDPSRGVTSEVLLLRTIDDVPKVQLAAAAQALRDRTQQRSKGVPTHLRVRLSEDYRTSVPPPEMPDAIDADKRLRQLQDMQREGIALYAGATALRASKERIGRMLENKKSPEYWFMSQAVEEMLHSNLGLITEAEVSVANKWQLSDEEVDVVDGKKEGHLFSEERFQVPRLKVPKLTTSGVKAVNGDEAELVPPREVIRKDLMWFGSCAEGYWKRVAGGVTLNAKDPSRNALGDTNAFAASGRLSELTKPAAERGFVVPMNAASGWAKMLRVSFPGNAWTGEYYRNPLRRNRVEVYSDVLLLIDLGYPIAKTTRLTLDYIKGEEAAVSEAVAAHSAGLGPHSGSGGHEQTFLFVLHCLPLEALLTRKWTVTVRAEGRASASLPLRMLIDSTSIINAQGRLDAKGRTGSIPYDEAEGDALPKWFVEALRGQAIRDRIGALR